jgi:ribosome recycling factor
MEKNTDPRLEKYKTKMSMTMDSYRKDISGIRAGRASVSLLEPIKVDSEYGLVPLSHVSTISSPDARLLTVQVWDNSLVKAVEKAIRESMMNLNPSVEGQLIRIPIPPLNTERRNELSKLAAKYAEDSRVAIRNIRREAMESIKGMEKNGEISEDEKHKLSDLVQKITDDHVKKIDSELLAKQDDISKV